MNEHNNDSIEKTIREAAEGLQPNAIFIAELDGKLRKAHKPGRKSPFSMRGFVPAITSVVALGILTIFMLWLLQSLDLQPAPGDISASEEALTSESVFIGETIEYEVREGDTCSQLAERHGITVEELMKINGLNECTIFIGMKLILPIRGIVTPQPTEGGYDWRGTILYLEAAMPQTPSEAKIYQAQAEVPATIENARAFAQRFGMNGEIYQISGEMPDTKNYLIVEGNRQLRIRSDGYFTYILDQTDWMKSPFFVRNENAETVIADFMQTHGFDAEYIVEYSELYGGYHVLPLTPDGFPLALGHFTGNGLLFRFNENGLLAVDVSLLNYSEVLNATVISADEAFQRLISENGGYGIDEGVHSGNQSSAQTWSRPIAFDKTITYFGWLRSTDISIDGGAPLITLDGYTVTGNIANIEPNIENMYIETTGFFHEENGFKTFVMESWKIYEGFEEGIQGKIEREGDQVFITTIDKPKLLLPDFPSGIPLPVDNLFVLGVTRGEIFDWKTIDTRMQGGGGGGGGGGGFYKVNVSGTPVPFPTPQASAPNLEAPTPQRMDGVRGIVSITIYVKEDGSQRSQYSFLPAESGSPYAFLEGENLGELLPYHNVPVKIWGDSRVDENGMIVVNMEKFEALFQDLQFQIMKGSERIAQIENREAVVFTAEDGTEYVELASNCYDVIDSSFRDIQSEDEAIMVEALVIPDVTLGGRPSICIFQTAFGFYSSSNQPFEMSVTANQPNIFPEPPGSSTYTAAIEKIEFVYYVPNPRYFAPGQNSEPLYIQPVWRFTGHYSNGDEFEILIQALMQDFLLPEYQESLPPG